MITVNEANLLLGAQQIRGYKIGEGRSVRC